MQTDGLFRSILRSLKILRVYLIGNHIRMSLKVNGRLILTKNLTGVTTVIGFTIRGFLLISLALITCTCSGVRLMSVTQITAKPIDSSLYFGKPARLIQGVTECATLKTDGVDSHSWHQEKPSTWQPSQAMHDSVSYPNRVVMLKKCLPTKSYPYPLTTRFSSNLFKMVWIDRRLNWHIGFLLLS